MADTGTVAGSQLMDGISLGVLTLFVPRDAVDEAIEATGRGARRSDTTIPPRVAVYFVMALALFVDDNYEAVPYRLATTLDDLDVVGPRWGPTSGGLTKARQRLGSAPLAELFSQVAGPVADLDTVGAFLGPVAADEYRRAGVGRAGLGGEPRRVRLARGP
ncbi:transposase domain-containing protein [Parafrankia sp. FMc2]|uniref:transposase domain-containing protein n=1 Tax=Parafrankia sp. FMc2 TaxID=3233196 RepID=UPI0034D7B526